MHSLSVPSYGEDAVPAQAATGYLLFSSTPGKAPPHKLTLRGGATLPEAIMGVHKILAEFYNERQQLDEAIAAIERLAVRGQRRRGRPPKWLTEARKKPEAAKPKRGRK